MDTIVIIFYIYIISLIDKTNWCGIHFFFCIESILSIVITCIINCFWWILMRWYLFTYIFIINCLIIDTNNWLCNSVYLQSSECIKRNLGLNVDMRTVWISYNIITLWCIQIIQFATIDLWVNSNTSTLLILVWKLHCDPMFLFFIILMKLRAFCVTKIIPLKW